jgi:undecaprenyl-diphosphatase
MSIMQAFWLGLVQGLTEFLPISSSGHLDLVQKLFGFSADNFLTLAVLLHTGTLIAVVAVYWKRLWTMILDLFKNPLKSEIWLLVVATVPAVLAALLFDFDDAAFSGQFLGFAFLITTLILWLADLISGVSFQTKEVKWHNAVVMGIMQAVAILPGVSRSGSTISGGIATGLSRKRSADFAFLMSVPAILGAIVLELMKNGV